MPNNPRIPSPPAPLPRRARGVWSSVPSRGRNTEETRIASVFHLRLRGAFVLFECLVSLPQKFRMKFLCVPMHFLSTFYPLSIRFLYRIRTTFAAKQAVFRQNREVSRSKKKFAGCLSPATCHGELKRSTGEWVENKSSITDRTTNDTYRTNTGADRMRSPERRRPPHFSVPCFSVEVFCPPCLRVLGAFSWQ